ncbi:MgtC/SapB family protein [Thermomonas sp.]|uniref:MgtC/SapB family protein n=1 Tax=Thermomonas sp. TaxID=1971895 RepID=UPI0035AF17EA
MDLDVGTLQGMAAALGVGLLVGVERERRREEDGHVVAGVRTFALIGLAGAVAERVGGIGIAVGGAFVVLAALASYRSSQGRDPGLTTETAMLVVFLLGVLAMRELALAAGLGVAVAVLLAAKARAHHFVRKVLTSQELHDALLLAAAATVVLPLLPDHPIDPWRVLNPRKLWLLAVIVMAISAVGHVAKRAYGARNGLLLAGFAGGFASSTATIASMGARARRDPALAMACAGGGVISNVSTVVQLGVVVGLLSPPLLAHLWPALLVSGMAVVGFALVAARAARSVPADLEAPEGRAFEPRQALLFVAILSVVMVAAAAAQAWLGHAGLDATLALSGLVDAHAAAASAAQLVVAGRVAPQAALTGIALAFATNSATKLGVAWASGGRAYALRLLPGVVAMLVAFVLALWLL